MADTSILSWLGRASMCGDVDIERSAEMLKNYYQGIGPEPEYQEFGQSNDRQMIVKQDADGWPGEIYLQAGDDPLSHFSEYDEVSWCDHPQGESDVRYVRADESLVALASRPAEVCDEGLPTAPTAIPHASNDALNAMAKYWKLDGDWMTCKFCQRSLIASRDGEELAHKDGCKYQDQQHPWAQLRKLITRRPAPAGAAQ